MDETDTAEVLINDVTGALCLPQLSRRLKWRQTSSPSELHSMPCIYCNYIALWPRSLATIAFLLDMS